MGDVIKINKPEKIIWGCPCGNSKFFLYENGDTQCCECKSNISNLKCYIEEDEEDEEN